LINLSFNATIKTLFCNHTKKGEEMVERSEFKGKPVLVIKRTEDDQYPFSFGISKAKLILENIEEIKKFVSETEAKQ
jgi:uncharacterized protein YgiM (DUF1202 family)